MKPFTNFESRLVPLPNNNIDTDQIIPARFLKTTSKEGLDKQLFCDWRYDDRGNPKPDFILAPVAEELLVETLLPGGLEQIARAHVLTPVTRSSPIPPSPSKHQ